MSSAKKKPAAAKGGAGTITDIPHEEVPVIKDQEPAPEPLEVKAEPEDKPQLSLEVIKKNEVAKFSQAEQEIKELFALYGDLTIAGPEDKAGYEKAKKAFSVVRSKRTGFEKIGKGIRDQFNAINKAVTEIEDNLIDQLSPLELKLKGLYEAVDLQREKLQKEKEQQEQQRLNDRLKELMDLGMVFSEGYYVLGPTISLDVATLRSLSDEGYAKVRDAVKLKAEELAEVKRLEEKAEHDRLEKLRLEREKLDKEQLDLEEAQNLLQKEKDDLQRIKDEMAQEKLNIRTSVLQGLGMELSMSGETLRFVNDAKELKIKVAEIKDLTPDDFNTLVEGTRTAIELAKKELKLKLEKEEADKLLMDERKKRIAVRMEDAGLAYDYGTDTFWFENPLYKYRQTMTQLLEWSDDGGAIIDEVKKQVVKAVKDQQELDDKAKHKLEAERKAKLGDVGNFKEYLDNLRAVQSPKMRSGHYGGKIKEFSSRLYDLINEYTPAEETVKS